MIELLTHPLIAVAYSGGSVLIVIGLLTLYQENKKKTRSSNKKPSSD